MTTSLTEFLLFQDKHNISDITVLYLNKHGAKTMRQEDGFVFMLSDVHTGSMRLHESFESGLTWDWSQYILPYS